MKKELTIDYNKMMELNTYFQGIYEHLKNSHQDLLKIIENGDCFDSEKKDQLFSYLKEYEAKILNLKSDMILIDAENKKIESCLSETRLLKKKRVIKLESNINKPRNIGVYDEEEDYIIKDEDPDLPF